MLGNKEILDFSTLKVPNIHLRVIPLIVKLAFSHFKYLHLLKGKD